MNRHMIIGRCMTSATVTDALRLIHKHGGNAIQISLGRTDDKVVKHLAEDDVRTALKIRKKHDFYVVVHGKYLYNFCRPPQEWSWQRTMLAEELREAQRVRSDVVIHQGKNVLKLDRSLALQNYVDNVISVLDSVPELDNKLLLENSARQGTEVGYDIEELGLIFRMMPERLRPRVGFCLDLCHVFVAGALDVRRPEAVRAWLERLESLEIPLSLVHFNDSNVAFDGHNDEHANIGQGYIGNPALGGNMEGFKVVAQYCQDHKVPMILETGAANVTFELALVKSLLSV